MTPGIFPSARRFRLISFPVSWRRSAVNSIIAIFSLLLYEQRADRILEMDPLDGLAQQGRHREDVKLLARRLVTQRESCSSPRAPRSPTSRAARWPGPTGPRGWRRRRYASPPCGAGRRRTATSVPAVSTMSSSSIAVFPSTSPMMFITSATLGASAALVDDGEGGVEPLGEGPGPLHAPGVRGDDHDVVPVVRLDVLEHHRRRVKVVHRDVEESLDLAGVQVHREHPRDARRRQEVRHELRRDGGPREDLPVLPRVPVIREHRRDPLRRGALEARPSGSAAPSGGRSPGDTWAG